MVRTGNGQSPITGASVSQNVEVPRSFRTAQGGLCTSKNARAFIVHTIQDAYGGILSTATAYVGLTGVKRLIEVKKTEMLLGGVFDLNSDNEPEQTEAQKQKLAKREALLAELAALDQE